MGLLEPERRVLLDYLTSRQELTVACDDLVVELLTIEATRVGLGSNRELAAAVAAVSPSADDSSRA
jgi:hypothetical protein